MRCENCHVEINSISNNCPLCGKYIHESEGEDFHLYPKFQEIKLKKESKITKILLFSTILFTIFILGLNEITPHKYYWGIIPAAGVWLSWILVGIPIVKGKLTPLKIIQDDIIISFFLIVIDITFNLHGWTLSYIGPFVPSGTALIVTLIVAFLKTTWREFYLFQITIAAACFIPIILRIFINFELWPSLVSALYGFVTIMAMIIFGDKKFKYETKKRLHF